MKEKKTIVDQLRGATQLAVDAIRGVTDLVETMHQTIGAGPRVLGRPLESTAKTLIAPSYGAVRGVTAAVGASLDLALTALSPLLEQAGAEGSPLLAALNGVIGDYMAETDNPLAIEMAMCSAGAELPKSAEQLQAAFPAGGRLLLLLHGSSMDDSCWSRKGHDHGAALAADAGLIPIYLRYNSGRHISQNGRDFSAQLEELATRWPRPVEELLFLGHSMGGLVARSACLAGEEANHTWRRKLGALVTLGSPHHGAPLERGGNWLEFLLGVSRYSAPLAALGRLRSAGVTDLRYGNVRDTDWQGQSRFALGEDPRNILALPAGVECYAVAASTGRTDGSTPPGDGLVPVDSALGRHRDPARTLAFAESHTYVALGANHLDLLARQDVYAQLRDWLA